MVQSPQSDVAYRPEIDGLRAIAVASVVLYHAFPSLLPGGFVGVDIFFVISGYLISSIIFKQLDEGRFSLADFYARRVRRIFPALVLVVGTTLAFGWHVLLPDELTQLGFHAAAGLGFVANLVFWSESGYFDVEAHRKILLHLWSLGVEEQFYLVWPLLAIVAWRFRRLRLVWIVAELALASFALNLALIWQHPEAAFYMPFARFWEMLCGVLLALYARKPWPALSCLVERYPDRIAIAGVSLLVAAFALIDKNRSFPGWWAALPTAGAMLIVLPGTLSRFNSHRLSAAPLVWLGLISYPLYLWHWPILTYARIIEGAESAWWIRAAAVLLAVALSFATWRLIEIPIRTRRGRVVVPGLLTAGLCTAVVGGALFMQGGVPSRVPLNVVQEFETLKWGRELNASVSCRKKFREPYLSYCLESQDNDTPPNVMIVGDSHANQYYWALKEHYDSRSIKVMNIGRGACPVQRHLEQTRHGMYSCEKIANYILDFALEHDEVKTVIIANRWYRDFLGGVKDTANPDAHSPIEAMERTLDETLAELTAAGKQVILIGGMPTFPFNARDCIRTRPFYLSDHSRQEACAMSALDYGEQAALYMPTFERLKTLHPKVKFISPADFLCDEDACEAKKNGKILFRDEHHLSLAGASALANWMLRTPMGLASGSSSSIN